MGEDGHDDALARFGGWMLLAWGVVLVVLACVFAEHPTVAPIFAFTGVACFVLGVLVARFEGDFELSTTGLKGKLRALVAREDLTLEDKGDELVRLVQAKHEPGSSSTSTESSQRPVVVPTPASKATAFEIDARHWFESSGWTIEPSDLPFAGDFWAVKGETRFLVEAKARSRLSAADVAGLIGTAEMMRGLDQVPDFKLAIVTPQGALTPSARRYAAEASPAPELIEISDESIRALRS